MNRCCEERSSPARAQMPIAALPTEVLSHVLAQLRLVRNIQGVKRTCRAFRDAAAEAERKHRRVCFVEIVSGGDEVDAPRDEGANEGRLVSRRR